METNSNKKIWFKRKRYGWGWTPKSWEGWLVTALYIASLVYIFRSVDRGQHSGSDTLINFALPFIILTVIFLAICYKTGEYPKWTWGKSDLENK